MNRAVCQCSGRVTSPMATHLTPQLYRSTGPQHATVTQGHTRGPEWKWPRYTKTDRYIQTCYRVLPVGSRDCSGPKVLGQAPQVCQLTLYFLAWTGKCPTADKETSLGSHIRLGMGDIRRTLPCTSPGCFSLHLPLFLHASPYTQQPGLIQEVKKAGTG